MECRFCKGICVKKGKRNRIQRFQCKECFRYQQQEYVKAIIPLPQANYYTNLTTGDSYNDFSKARNIEFRKWNFEGMNPKKEREQYEKNSGKVDY